MFIKVDDNAEQNDDDDEDDDKRLAVCCCCSPIRDEIMFGVEKVKLDRNDDDEMMMGKKVLERVSKTTHVCVKTGLCCVESK